MTMRTEERSFRLQLPLMLNDLKTGLGRHYGDRLRGVYLFGSYARREENSESDVDVLIVLDHFPRYGTEVDATAHLVSELCLEYTVSINIVFIREADWQGSDTPFLKNVREEAVAA